MEWIKCEDRLPPPDRLVIVAGGVAYCTCDGIWKTCTYCDSKPIEWEVKHWMPLPEPPKN